MKARFQPRTTAGAAILLAMTLVGCASPASREGMLPSTLDTTRTHPYSVRVQTGGGAETGALDTTNIADADLKATIEEAIARNKVFRSVVQGKDGDYELTVRVSSLTKPLFGLTFTVEMEAAWSLVKVSDRSVAIRKSVRSTGTATPGDALVAVTRLRLAVEAAARDNITQGIKAVATLDL